MTGRVLSVAESDSCGASGIQADVKTILALGGYAMTAVSCLIAQDTKGYYNRQSLSPAFVTEQMRVSIADLGVDAIKIGFLDSEATINAVSDVLDMLQEKNIPVVVDPSIVARKGSVLVDEAAIAAWKRRLYIRARVLTPNVHEAEVLSGMHIKDIDDMRHAADMMRTLGVENILLKAGRVASDKVLYMLATEAGETIYERPSLETHHTVGAGCTLSAALATSLGQGLSLHLAVERALDFMHQAILHAGRLGGEIGPLNHAFAFEQHSTFYHPENIKVRKV